MLTRETEITAHFIFPSIFHLLPFSLLSRFSFLFSLPPYFFLLYSFFQSTFFFFLLNPPLPSFFSSLSIPPFSFLTFSFLLLPLPLSFAFLVLYTFLFSFFSRFSFLSPFCHLPFLFPLQWSLHLKYRTYFHSHSGHISQRRLYMSGTLMNRCPVQLELVHGQ